MRCCRISTRAGASRRILTRTHRLVHCLPVPQVRREFLFLLGAFARQGTSSSNRIARMAFLTVPPSLDAGEITDKGSINQRAVLRHRAAVVDVTRRTPVGDRGG